MGNHDESHKTWIFLFVILFTLTASNSASALHTDDDGLIVSVKGRVEEGKHHVRVVYDERGVTLNTPSYGIRNTLKLRSNTNNRPSGDGFVRARLLQAAFAHIPELADGIGGGAHAAVESLTPASDTAKGGSNSKNNHIWIIVVAIVLSLLTLGLAAIIIYCIKKRKT